MLGIYCRISRVREDGTGRSIDDQEQLGIEKAKELNFAYKVYKDEGVSGTWSIEKRPAFSELINDIIEGEINSVYVFDESRIERNTQTRFTVLKIFKDNEIRLFTYGGEIDLLDEDSEMMGHIKSVMNQYYVTITKRKIKSVLRRNAKEGKVHARPPYGYSKDENNFMIIDEEESKVVKRIYSDSLNGIGMNKIAENLNKEGIKTSYSKKGKGSLKITNKDTKKIVYKKKSDIKWSGRTVGGIIKNSIYKGIRVFKEIEYKSPIIIEPNQWKKVNDNLAKNRNNSGKKVEHKYLLKGVLECGYCNRNMYGRTRENKKDHYYMCSSKRHKDLNCGNRSINIDFIEKFIWEIVLGDANVLKDLKNINSETSKIEEFKKEKINIEKEIIRLNNEIARTNQLLIAGALNIEEVIKNKSSRQKLIEDNQIRLHNKNKEIDFEEEAIELRKEANIDLNKLVSEIPYNKRKELISKYISRVYIDYNKFIKFYYITVDFKTITGEQTYAFSSNPNRMKRFIETGEVHQTKEEKELIASYLHIESVENKIDEYITNNENISRSRSRR